MKKLTSLLFIAGLFVIGLTNTNCGRKGGDITPISGGDTQKTTTKVDSTGEDMNITITEDHITTNSVAINGGRAVVYLFNNFNDYQAYSNTGSHNSTFIDSVVITNGGNTCQFKKIKPASSPTNPAYFKSGPNAGKPYLYYMAAEWVDTKGKKWKGWYTLSGNNAQADQITVTINNGINKSGVPFPMSVSHP